jgi:regulatory protein YycI of two-component signal transduction system YycFG
MTDKKQRTRNFSEYEKNLVTELIKIHEIVLSKSKDAKSLKQKEEAWTTIIEKFNADDKVTKRDPENIKSCIHNLVNRAKKDLGSWKKEVNKTGGGTNELGQSSSSTTLAELMPSLSAFKCGR